MNSSIPYSSYVVDDENCQSMLSPDDFLTWLHTFEMQADAKLVPAVPQLSLQNQDIQPNMLSQPSQPWQQTFLAQEFSGLPYVAPQLDNQALDPVQFAPDDVPAGPQSPFDDWSPTSTIQGESNPLQFEPPWPSQNQGAQPDTAADAQPQVCPLCKVAFHRKQERDRHIRSFLPHSIYCVVRGCAWRGDRHDNLKKHIRTKHAHFKFTVQPRCQIYNPDPLVELIVLNQLSVESAAEFALLLVECRAHGLKKVGIWKNWWGRKPKKFDH